jgi:hypothetical protein
MAEEKAEVKLIRVKSNVAKLGNKIALFEQHPDHPPQPPNHPGGDVSIHGEKVYNVAETEAVLDAIHDERLIKVGDVKKAK